MTVWGVSVAPQLSAQPAACTRAKLTVPPASAPFRALHSFLGFFTISVPALLSHHLLSPSSPCRPPAFLPSDFCPSAPRRSWGQLLWGWLGALAGPGASAEPRGEGRAGAETDQHRGGAALEKRLQHQRRPPAGRQHLPLGLFCVTLQAWYQPRQVKHSQARPAGDRLPSHLTVHTEPSEAETAGTPKEHPIQPVH